MVQTVNHKLSVANQPRALGVRAWLLIAGLLVAVALLLFAACLDTGTFIDGPDSALRLPLVSTWRNVRAIFSPEFMIHTEGQYRPLSYALLAAARTFVPADNVLFWHAWLVLFHVANALLLFAVARQFASRTASALFAAAFFLVHPLASVFANEVNPFHYVLGLTFYLGTFLAFVRFARTGRPAAFAAALVLFPAGLLTSKVLLTLPVLMLVWAPCFERVRLRRTLLWLLPFVALLALLSPCWLWLTPHPVLHPLLRYTPEVAWYSFYSAVGAGAEYFGGLAAGWSVNIPLAEDAHRVYFAHDPRFLLWGAAWLVLMAVALRGLVKRQWFAVGALMMLLGSLPYVTSVVNVSPDFVSWNYLYVPLAGFALLLGGILDLALLSAKRRLRVMVPAAGIALMVFLASQCLTWNVHIRSPHDYWSAVLKRDPTSRIASIALGRALLAEGTASAEREALARLFTPATTSVLDPSTVMARYYCRKGDLDAAVVHLRAASQEPEKRGRAETDFLRMRVEVFIAANAFDYAEQDLGYLLMLDPDDADAMKRLAKVCATKGYLNAAIEWAREARRIVPDDAEARRLIRDLEARRLDPERLDRGVRVVPPSPDFLRYIDDEPATRAVRKQIAPLADTHPNDPIIRLESGLCLLDLGEVEAARAALKDVVKRLPSYPYATKLASRAAAQAGDITAMAVDSTGKTPEDAAMLADLGNMLSKQGKTEQAVSAYRAALKADPGSAKIHNQLGVVLALKGDYAGAAGEFREAVRLGLDSAETHANLALVLSKLDRLDDAADEYRRASTLAPGDPEPVRNLASVLERRRKFREAKDVLSEGMKRNPSDAGLSTALAWLLATAPDDELRSGAEAVRLAEAAKKSGGAFDPRALDALAAAYAETGRFEQAVAAAETALSLAQAKGDAGLAAEIEKRIQLYRKSQPYRQE